MARKILLADDSVTAQSMGRRILTDAGYEVVTVSNGSAALKRIAESKPDLIVLDVYMPGYGGLEVCQRLKETRETARIPVLLSVGKLEPFKPEEARRVRADAYIVKPFEASELLTALTKLEDKIVPQPEPYKQGRFAKAIAAAGDESFGDSETGWKERLIIPAPGSKAAEQETEAVHADTGFRNLAREEDFKPAEPKQGFERPIPAGLPADISPEEIAAIAAAAAAVSGNGEEPAHAAATEVAAEPAMTAELPTATSEEPKPEPVAEMAAQVPPEATAAVAEELKPEPPAVEAPSDVPAATFASAPEAQTEAAPDIPSDVTPEPVPVPPAVEAAPVPEPAASSEATAVYESPASAETPAEPAKTESTSMPEPAVAEAAKPAATDAEVLAALASLAPLHGDDAADAVEKTGPTPVSVGAVLTSTELAAVNAGIAGPRWIAEAIAVDEQESTFLLEQEMEKAYAAMAAAEAAQTSFAARAMETVTAGVAEITAASSSAASLYAAPEFSSAVEQVSEQIAAAPATAFEPAATLPPEPGPPAIAEVASESSSAPEVPTPAAASTDTVAAPVEEVAMAAAASASSGPMEANSAADSSSLAPPAEPSLSPAREFEAGERERESELAAAWANWKQVHEPDTESQAAAQIADAEAGFRDMPKEEPPAPEPKPEPQAEAATAAPEESADISEIVDDMLAELKPKLMAEISKKLKKKNKK